MRFLVTLSLAVPSASVRVPAAPALLNGAPALSSPPAAASLQASPATPLPAAASAPAAVGVDKEAALVATLSARLCGSDCVARRKTATWIGELASAHPREAVQSAAVRGLAADAAASNDLLYFQHATGLIGAFASVTPHDSVFAQAADALVDAARTSGRAQRLEAVAAVVRLGSAASPERRARAAAALESLRADPAFRLDAEYLERALARLRG
ncbi:MAG: hypothetical protein HY079_10530 [Elusimicrobia bacterium]|nr:hypothetical protein [Elusimicrobiota bacterium]